MTRSVSPFSSMSPTTAPARASASAPAPALTSMLTTTRSANRSRVSARVGMGSPVNSVLKKAPASSPESCESDVWDTSPVPSVVRSSVSSWMTTSSPLPHRVVSSSNGSERSAATAKPAAVFSGATERAPRWPMTVTASGKRWLEDRGLWEQPRTMSGRRRKCLSFMGRQ